MATETMNNIIAAGLKIFHPVFIKFLQFNGRFARRLLLKLSKRFFVFDQADTVPDFN